jgi:hypothetical protein
VVLEAGIPDGRRRVVAVAEVVDPPAEGRRVRSLAGHAGLHTLPHRPARATGAPAPDPRWCEATARA